MIELNLLPDNLKKVQKKKATVKLNIKMPQIPIIPVAIAILVIFVVGHLALSFLVTAQKRSIIKLSNEMETFSPQAQEAQEIKGEFDRLNGKLSVITSLTNASLLWSKKLSDLSEATTEGVWLTALYLDKDEPPRSVFTSAYTQAESPGPPANEKLVLEGMAVSAGAGEEETAIIGRFIKSLKSHSEFFNEFDDIKVSSIQRSKLGDVEVMGFTIVCNFKPGRSYFERLEKP